MPVREKGDVLKMVADGMMNLIIELRGEVQYASTKLRWEAGMS